MIINLGVITEHTCAFTHIKINHVLEKLKYIQLILTKKCKHTFLRIITYTSFVVEINNR